MIRKLKTNRDSQIIIKIEIKVLNPRTVKVQEEPDLSIIYINLA